MKYDEVMVYEGDNCDRFYSDTVDIIGNGITADLSPIHPEELMWDDKTDPDEGDN